MKSKLVFFDKRLLLGALTFIVTLVVADALISLLAVNNVLPEEGWGLLSAIGLAGASALATVVIKKGMVPALATILVVCSMAGIYWLSRLAPDQTATDAIAGNLRSVAVSLFAIGCGVLLGGALLRRRGD